MPPEYLGDSNHTGERWLRTGSLLQIEKENAAVSCLKNGFQDPGSLVLRIFETEGKGAAAEYAVWETRRRQPLLPGRSKHSH